LLAEILKIIKLKSLGFSNRKISRLMHRSTSTISKYTNPRRRSHHWKPLPFNKKEPKGDAPHFFPTLEEMDEVVSAEMDKRVYLVFSGYRPDKHLSEYKSWKEIHRERIVKMLTYGDPNGHHMNLLVNLRWCQLLPEAFS